MEKEHTLGMLAHLLGIFTGFLGPLVVWLVGRKDSEFVDDQGKQSLNFQWTLLVIQAVLFILILVFAIVSITIAAAIFFLLAILVELAALYFIVIATIHAAKGDDGTYPWAITFLK